MGRHTKHLPSAFGDRRESGYYSTPEFVSNFIGRTLLELNPRAATCLDPAVGRGELVKLLRSSGVSVDGFDIHPFSLPPGLSFRQEDFLQFYAARRQSNPFPGTQQLPYDLYVAIRRITVTK